MSECRRFLVLSLMQTLSSQARAVWRKLRQADKGDDVPGGGVKANAVNTLVRGKKAVPSRSRLCL